jgi:GMP synthase-like glutamine amidotransferase
MRIHVLQFDERVGLGTFSNWITEQGSEITTWRCDLHQWPAKDDCGPLILLGGYMGVGDRHRLPYLRHTATWLGQQVEKDRPILAICLGSQLLAHALGAEVYHQFRKEKGSRRIALTEAGQQDPLFQGMPNPFVSFEWHSDCFDIPRGALHLAATETCGGQAFRFRNAWGVQFHPELDGRIIADWCQRTASASQLLEDFFRIEQSYFKHSRQLLGNFLTLAAQLNR